MFSTSIVFPSVRCEDRCCLCLLAFSPLSNVWWWVVDTSYTHFLVYFATFSEACQLHETIFYSGFLIDATINSQDLALSLPLNCWKEHFPPLDVQARLAPGAAPSVSTFTNQDLLKKYTLITLFTVRELYQILPSTFILWSRVFGFHPSSSTCR